MIIKDTTYYLGHFIFKTFLVKNTCKAFTKRLDNTLHIQSMWERIKLAREFRKEFLYKRLETQKDYLIKFYTKKKSNKKGQRAWKALEKMFAPNRQADRAKIMEQIEITFLIQGLEAKAINYSIEIRALTILNQILKTCTLKDEEKKPIYKDWREENEKRIKFLITLVTAI